MRILVVEDDPVNQDALEYLLSSVGHTVDHAGDGYGALTRLAIHKFDLVITDYRMPGLDGIEMIKRLRTNSYNKCPFFIVMSAVAKQDYPSGEDSESSLGYRIIHKPFEPNRLLSLIDSFSGEYPS